MYKYRVMSISCDGARYYDQTFTTESEAVEFADQKQRNADAHYDVYAKAFNSLGFHYIVQRVYDTCNRVDTVHETKIARVWR